MTAIGQKNAQLKMMKLELKRVNLPLFGMSGITKFWFAFPQAHTELSRVSIQEKTKPVLIAIAEVW